MGGSRACVPDDRGEQATRRENGEESRREFVYVGVTPPAIKQERGKEG